MQHSGKKIINELNVDGILVDEYNPDKIPADH